MRGGFLCLVLGCSLGLWAQSSSSPTNPSPASNSNAGTSQPTANPQPGSASSRNQPSQSRFPDSEPPRSDRDIANPGGDGSSSSNDTAIDLSPPPDDAKKHPGSSEAVQDAEMADRVGTSEEVRPWDPHKAAKDVEVGDFYFKAKNYRAAEDRYREALYYKDNDAIATFRLAECLERMKRPDEARSEYENYLKILPDGPESKAAKKAMDRLTPSPGATPTK